MTTTYAAIMQHLGCRPLDPSPLCPVTAARLRQEAIDLSRELTAWNERAAALAKRLPHEIADALIGLRDGVDGAQADNDVYAAVERYEATERASA